MDHRKFKENLEVQKICGSKHAVVETEQTWIKDLIGYLHDQLVESFVFCPMKWKIPLCSRGQTQILFLAKFENWTEQ